MNKPDIQKRLNENVCNVTFTKVSGEIRSMRCTTQPDLVGSVSKKTERQKTENDYVVSVWDLENNGWRSFRLDSIIKFAEEE